VCSSDLDLKGIGRARARKLFQSGYTSLEKLKAADQGELARILGPKIATKVISQFIGEKENNPDIG
jgi:helicase